jgi:hypothetical protein
MLQWSAAQYLKASCYSKLILGRTEDYERTSQGDGIINSTKLAICVSNPNDQWRIVQRQICYL